MENIARSEKALCLEIQVCLEPKLKVPEPKLSDASYCDCENFTHKYKWVCQTYQAN